MSTASGTADVIDLSARRARREEAVARIAASPVRHVTPEFLAALNCRDLPGPRRGRGHLHAV